MAGTWRRGLGAGWFAALCLAAPAWAAAPGLDAVIADQPLETSLAAAALVQLGQGGGERTGSALHELERLLLLSGHRARAVDEALEAGGAAELLQQAAATSKSKDHRALAARLGEQVRARLGLDGVSGALKVAPGSLTAPTAQAVQGARAWLTMDAPGGQEVTLKLAGCGSAEARLFDPSGRRLTGVVRLDDFTPQPLVTPAGAKALLVRLDAAEGCAGWGVAVAARPGPRPLARGTSYEAPARLDADVVYQVVPEAGETLWAAFLAEPGSIYEVTTSELFGNTDTRLSVSLPGAAAPLVDDDSGGGLSSLVRFDTLLGGEVRVEVDLLRAHRDSRYKLEVRRVFRYDVAPGLALSAEPSALPPAAWGGFVVPVTLANGEGRVRFQAVSGNVYRVQTDLDVSFVGPGGAPGFRVLAAEEARPWSVRPYRVFLALENGSTEMRFRAPQGAGEGPWFVQVINEPDLEPVPREVTYAGTVKAPMGLVPTAAENWDGGVIGEVAPGAVVWARFTASAGASYRVGAESVDPAAALSLGLYETRQQGTPLAVAARTGPLVSVRPPVAGEGTYLVRLENTGSEATVVRLAAQADVAYDGFRLGDLVKLARHRAVAGDTNWSDEMAPYVGRNGRVTSLAGQDGSGSWVVRIDVDGGAWVWRTRDLTLAQRVAD